jgi:hypothetical protein
MKTTALTTLHELADLPHITISIKLVDRRTNTTHKPITWWDHVRASAYMPIPGLDARGVTPELKLNIEILLVLNLVFFSFYWGLFYFILLLFLSSFCIINFTITIFLSPSLSFLILGYKPLFSLPATLSVPSYPLSSCPHLPLVSSSNPSPHYPFLLHTYLPLTSLLYKLYTTPTSCSPWHNHPRLQQQKYTQTHTRVTKPSSPIVLLPLTHSTSSPPF